MTEPKVESARAMSDHDAANLFATLARRLRHQAPSAPGSDRPMMLELARGYERRVAEIRESHANA